MALSDRDSVRPIPDVHNVTMLGDSWVQFNFLKLLIAVVLLFTQVNIWAKKCEHTPEYIQAREEALEKVKEVNKSFDSCRSSTTEANYWKAVAECKSKGLGKNIGGGCAHLVGYGSYSREPLDTSHCEIFKVSRELEKQYFFQLVSEIKIKKCK